MAAEIRLAFDYVDDLRLTMVRAVGDLAGVLYMEDAVSESPRVSNALGDFHSRWDAKRMTMMASLNALQDGLTAIRDNMRAFDQQLDASLGGGSDGS